MVNKNGKDIIISADDFGISCLATENILKLVKQKKIDRVEVMISDNITSSNARDLIRSGINIDVHLHLAKDKLDFWQTNERKIDSSATKRTIAFVFNYLSGKSSKKKTLEEWDRQIKIFIKIFGRVPDGVSSHEHIHFFPPYFNCILKLSEKYGIGYVRFGRKTLKNKNIISHILNWLRKANIKNFNGSSLKSSDYMVSFDWTEKLDDVLKNCQNHVLIEAVFHPEKNNEFAVLANNIDDIF